MEHHQIRTRRLPVAVSRKPGLAGLMVAVMLGMGGCAGLPVADQSPEDAVTERTLERDRAYQADDYEAVYAFFSPGYRQSVSLEQFRKTAPFSFDLKEYEVLSVDCGQADRCEVKKRWVYRLNTPMGKLVGDVDKVKKEVWIRIKDEWYYYSD
mgnify:CR=1 FL=1